jgi:metal-dependent amidase/aminoacylase/carboxypeptidase family protein
VKAVESPIHYWGLSLEAAAGQPIRAKYFERTKRPGQISLQWLTTPHLQGREKADEEYDELSMLESNTSDRLAEEISAFGYELVRKIGKTGLVGIMKNGKGPTLLIRADMDGLPVFEKTDLEYALIARQVNLEGDEMPVMHACGHDMHITTLIGVARRMVELKDQWQGTLVLVGQPAEEAEGGAKAMVVDGLYDRIGRPDFALALHVAARHPAGKIAFSDGLMYSSADTVRITVRSAMLKGMDPDAFVPWYQSDMGAEDFPDLINIGPPIPAVYFEVVGTPPELLATGAWASHHSPLFKIDPEASIKKGVEAMTLAALGLLPVPSSLFPIAVSNNNGDHHVNVHSKR